MLIMVEKEGEYVTLFIDMQKLVRNTWKIMIKTKNRQIFNTGMEIIYMVGSSIK